MEEIEGIAVFDCTDPIRRRVGIQSALEAVTSGGLVVIPADTSYGIGCDAFNIDAVQRVNAVKLRGPERPLPVLVGRIEIVNALARDVPAYARALMERFWPGGITLGLLAQRTLSWELGLSAGAVWIRIPANDVALEVLRGFGPMAVTGANTFGSRPSTTVEQATSAFGDKVQAYLDARQQGLSGERSTLVDCTGEFPRIVRRGAVSGDQIRETLPLE